MVNGKRLKALREAAGMGTTQFGNLVSALRLLSCGHNAVYDC